MAHDPHHSPGFLALVNDAKSRVRQAQLHSDDWVRNQKDVEEVQLDTPFGSPSDAYIVGTLEGQRVAFRADAAFARPAI